MTENDIGQASFYANLRQMLTQEIQILEEVRDLPEQRYERFRRIGVPTSKKEEDQ